jgi:hypothetical protein
VVGHERYRDALATDTGRSAKTNATGSRLNRAIGVIKNRLG